MRGQQRVNAIRQPRHSGEIDRLAACAVELLLRIARREAALETGQNGIGVPVGQDVARAAGADAEFVSLRIAAAVEVDARARLHIHFRRLGDDGFLLGNIGEFQAVRFVRVQIEGPGTAVEQFPERKQAVCVGGSRGQAAVFECQRVGGMQLYFSERRPDAAALDDILRLDRQAAERRPGLARRGIALRKAHGFARREYAVLHVAGGRHHRAMERQIRAGLEFPDRANVDLALAVCTGFRKTANQMDCLFALQRRIFHAFEYELARQLDLARLNRERAARCRGRRRRVREFAVVAQANRIGGQCGIAARRFDARRVEAQFPQRHGAARAEIETVFQPDHAGLAGKGEPIEPGGLDGLRAYAGIAVERQRYRIARRQSRDLGRKR